MNVKHVWIVFKKEVKDIVRDKKTMLTSLLIPIILMPVLFALLGGGMAKMERDMSENITVALSAVSDSPQIRDLVQEIFAPNPSIKILEAVEEPITTVRNGRVRFVLEIDRNFQEKLAEGKTFGITIVYDHSDTKSAGSYRFVAEAITAYQQGILHTRLQALGIEPELLQVAALVNVNAADEKSSGNFMLMMILPMLVAVLIAVGGIPAATDLVAGEKERSTFEPLLTAKAGRMSILFGKYLTVTLFSMISVVSQFCGIALGAVISPGFFTMAQGGGELSFYIPPSALLMIILITITLGMVFAGIQLAISTYARSFKEAQTYLSFLIFAAMIPAYATMMLQPSDLQPFMFAVPLLNAIASMKMILGNVINYSYLFIALGSSMLYVLVSLIFATNLFNREKVLFRS